MTISVLAITVFPFDAWADGARRVDAARVKSLFRAASNMQYVTAWDRCG
jgi:hypothetical protein